jgi:hypothetical protein
MKTLIVVAVIVMAAQAHAERHELDNGMYYDDSTGQVEDSKFENTDISQKFNDPIYQDDIFAPWNDLMRQDDMFAPWNDPLSTPEDTNRYLHENGFRNGNYYNN